MKNSNKKLSLFISAGVLFLTASTLSSCSPSEHVFTIWAWNKNVDAIRLGIKTYQEQVDPNFKAKIEPFARKDIDSKFKTASQTNNKENIGDIVLCDGMNVLTFYDIWSDIFVDLKPYVQNEELMGILPSAYEGGVAEDKLLGLPLDAPPNVVFANKNLWEEDALTKVKNEGWTWNDYLEIGKKIHEKHKDVYMTSYNLRGDDRLYRVFTSQKGEWFMDREYNVHVGNENSIKAMEMVKEFKTNEILGHVDTWDYKSLMKAGKIAAEIQGFFLGGQLKDIAPEMEGQWEVLPLPKWNKEDANSASITGGSYLYANSKLEGKLRDDAVDFIKWMTLNVDTVNQSLKEAGVFPALQKAYDSKGFTSIVDPFYSNENIYKDVAQCAIDAKPILATKYNGFNYDVFIKAQEKILFSTEEVDIESTLQCAAEEMRKNAK